MATNQSEGPILVTGNSPQDIQMALDQVLARLDDIKGLRGDPTIYAATTVGAPGAQTQAARLADLPSEQPSSPLYWILQSPATMGDAPIDDLVQALWPWMLLAAQTVVRLGAPARLIDNTAGTANDTLQALPDPADTPVSADALRDDLVANLLPVLRNNYADLAATINAILERL